MICSTTLRWADTARRRPTTRKARPASRTSRRTNPDKEGEGERSEDGDAADQAEVRRGDGDMEPRKPQAFPRKCRTTPRWATQAPADPRRPASGASEPRSPDYRPFSTKNDEMIDAAELYATEELQAAAQLSRQAALAPAGRGGAAREPPAAPADGAANRAWNSTLKKACSTRPAFRASSSTTVRSFKMEETNFRTPW